MKKNKANHKAKTDSQTVITPSQPVGPQGRRTLREVWAGVGSFLPFLLFFLLTWLWASWWMGDSFRVAREYSFFTFYKPLLHGLWQQPFGHLWIVGRALLTLYRWPLVGGLMVALLLACGTWLVAYCLRLRPDSRWRPLSYLPAVAWMTWVAWMGLDLYYHSEPGCALGVLFIGFLVLAIDAFVIWTFKGKSRRLSPCPPYEGGSGHLSGKDVLLLFLLVIPFALTAFRHPYQRPFMRMQVQLLNEDWEGIVETAHAHELFHREFILIGVQHRARHEKIQRKGAQRLRVLKRQHLQPHGQKAERNIDRKPRDLLRQNHRQFHANSSSI